MTKFSFYPGDEQNMVDGLRRASASIWGEVKEVFAESFGCSFRLVITKEALVNRVMLWGRLLVT